MDAIKKHIGTYYSFKIDSSIYKGKFQGVGVIEGHCGLLFSEVYMMSRRMPRSLYLFVHPSRVRCIADDGFVHLRKLSRQRFRQYGLKNTISQYFLPKYLFQDACANHAGHHMYHVENVYG